MGGKQSVHIQTPELNLSEWQYIIDQSQIPEQYGIFRTLRNKKSGQKIDEYDFIWPNEQQYNYYLKSFNWRHRQSNLVNTKYILLNNHEEICSHSYMAKVYVEHIRIRISEISDIPYPDNLYVLMEALDGFGKIHKHSKYFLIEESQICVDEYGNVKIWVNSDLSINYPSNEGFIEYKQKGEEEMVESIVHIIAENTDPETEPELSFRDFYEQKKGGKGKRFEQAKVLVLNYARLNDTEIPNRFEAIVNMDNEEQMDLKSYTENSKSYQYNPAARREQPYYEGEERNQNEFYQNGNHYSPPVHSYSFGPHNPPHFVQHPHPQPYPQAAPYPHYIQQPHPLPQYPQHPQMVYQGNYPLQASPIYYIPHYARIEYPARHPNEIINQNPIYALPQPSPLPQELIFQNLQSFESLPNLNSNNGQNFPQEPAQFAQNIRGTVVSKANEEQGNSIKNQPIYDKDEDYAIQLSSQHDNIGTHHKNPSFSEADDLVARSLPIKAGYPSQSNQQLSSMGQSERVLYSHITPKEQWPINKDGFGLTKNSQLKLKDSSLSTHKNLTNTKSKADLQPIKYFYSLDQQFEIDPDIAADMARYLS